MTHKSIHTVCLLLAVVIAGCQTPPMSESKEDAHLKWNSTRAHMLCGVGSEQLRTGQLAEAARNAMDALGLDPQSIDARILLGKVYLEQGHYIAAEAELKKAANQANHDSQVMYLLGVAQEKAGRYEEALESYHQSLARDTNNLNAVMASAEVMVAMDRPEQAAAYVEAYLPMAQGDSGLHEISARLAMMRGDFRRAAKDYQHAVDINSKNISYQEELARAQYYAGMHADSLTTLRSLASTKGYEAPAWVFTLTGDCLMMVDRPVEARTAYEKVCSMQPESSGAWCNLAKAALALGDPSRASLNARQSLAMDRSNTEATLVLAYAMVQSGQAHQAIDLLESARNDQPDSAIVQMLLGRAHASSGDMNNARNCYAIALKIEPDNAIARKLLMSALRAK